jgi:hypothetical protein
LVENHAKYGNHVPVKNLMTKGVGIRNVKKVTLTKNYKSSTIVNIPNRTQTQILNMDQLDVPLNTLSLRKGQNARMSGQHINGKYRGIPKLDATEVNFFTPQLQGGLNSDQLSDQSSY